MERVDPRLVEGQEIDRRILVGNADAAGGQCQGERVEADPLDGDLAADGFADPGQDDVFDQQRHRQRGNPAQQQEDRENDQQVADDFH